MNISIVTLLVASSDVTKIKRITDILAAKKDIRIIGTASSCRQVLDLASELKPNIILMDIDIGGCGMDTISEVMSKNALPILVWSPSMDKDEDKYLSSLAIAKGALEVIPWSQINLNNGDELRKRLILLSKIKVITHIRKDTVHREGAFPPARFSRIIAIASSTGGPMALSSILKHCRGLLTNFAIPIVIAQHIADGYVEHLIKYLYEAVLDNGYSKITIKEGVDEEEIIPSTIYLSPSNKHMEVTFDHKIRLYELSASDIYHPSCDRLLSSAAHSCGKITIGIILTGMGNDGVKGMKDIKKAGGITIAQDEKSSIIFGMANIAIAEGCIDKILPLEKIGQELNIIVSGS